MNAHKLISPRKSRIQISRTGSVVVTDLWEEINGRDKTAAFALLPPRTAPKIGIVDFGLLRSEEHDVDQGFGTGAIYIHGCVYQCRTCYQPEFFREPAKVMTDVNGLSGLMLDFEKAAAASVSLIVDRYRREVVEAIVKAKSAGLGIPVVYKYAGSLSLDQIGELKNIIDIFLPDCKGISDELLSIHGLRAASYGRAVVESIGHVIATGKPVIIRHLIVPGFPAAFEEIRQIAETLALPGTTNAKLSILTEYMDPITKTISKASQRLIDRIVAFCERNEIRLIIQGTEK
jgi:uncharacterized Fe-S radical SAM superfamily protein PflX